MERVANTLLGALKCLTLSLTASIMIILVCFSRDRVSFIDINR